MPKKPKSERSKPRRRKPAVLPETLPVLLAKATVDPNSVLFAGLKPAPKSEKGQLREMTLEALRQLGGVAYLVALGREQPQLLTALLGRVLPMQVQGDPEKPVQIEVVHTFESSI